MAPTSSCSQRGVSVPAMTASALSPHASIFDRCQSILSDAVAFPRSLPTRWSPAATHYASRVGGLVMFLLGVPRGR
jgi:hypothetical protein